MYLMAETLSGIYHI